VSFTGSFAAEMPAVAVKATGALPLFATPPSDRRHPGDGDLADVVDAVAEGGDAFQAEAGPQGDLLSAERLSTRALAAR